MQMSESAKKQQEIMADIDKRAKKDKNRWKLIMLLIIAVEIAISVVIGTISLKLLPYSFIFAIIAVAITAKLCMAQIGKIIARQQNERTRVDNDTRGSRFDL